MSDIAEKAVSYAALILQDDNIEITEDKLNKLIEAAGISIPLYFQESKLNQSGLPYSQRPFKVKTLVTC